MISSLSARRSISHLWDDPMDVRSFPGDRGEEFPSHLSSKEFEAGRWSSWASLRKEIVDVSTGDGAKFPKFPEALPSYRQRL